MHFSPEELADLTRSVKRLILGAQDMIEARAAAVFLRERDDLGGDVRRALDTAIPVAYARLGANATPSEAWRIIGSRRGRIIEPCTTR